ncbi:MAG: rhodanese-like domain-containing protein [Candidatus Protistobacter heckmanni]|nr:rhodanese-like domain-containing protein [Candidatus Protistobacter heckmanni]
MSFFLEPTNLILIVLAVVSGALLAWPSLNKTKSGVNATAATQMINRRHAVVIDIRAAEDFAAGHLPNARHVSADDLEQQAGSVAKDKAAPVIVVCQTGTRSGGALRSLKKAGYAEVYALEGGLSAWQQAGMPVVKDAANLKAVRS